MSIIASGCGSEMLSLIVNASGPGPCGPGVWAGLIVMVVVGLVMSARMWYSVEVDTDFRPGDYTFDQYTNAETIAMMLCGGLVPSKERLARAQAYSLIKARQARAHVQGLMKSREQSKKFASMIRPMPRLTLAPHVVMYWNKKKHPLSIGHGRIIARIHTSGDWSRQAEEILNMPNGIAMSAYSTMWNLL